MRTVIIKYNAGNIQSVDFALKRLGVNALVTNEKDAILSADKVIFPGVGEAGTAMDFLRKHALDGLIRNLKQPFLGICLGLQLMCERSDESDTRCIGIFSGHVKKFPGGRKVPHMGWNALNRVKGRILKGLSGEYMYFVHSYYAPVTEETAAVTEYGVPFSAGLEKDNFFATQFHPEKSGVAGEKILKSFLAL